MKKYLISLFLICNFVFGFDSVEVLNSNITIHKSGYFKTDKDLTPQEALLQNFTPLPQKAKSFGFDSNTYWFMFEVKSNKENLLLESRNNISQYANLHIFKDSQYLTTIKNGFEIPIQDRNIKTLQQRFELQNGRFTYLLEIKSIHPHYFGFAFGNMQELDKDWNIIENIFIFTLGIFTALIFYNLFLYFTLKDKAYIYYIIYISGLEFYNTMTLGHYHLISPIIGSNIALLAIGAFIIMNIGLVFFTIEFLKLEKYSHLKKIILWLLAGSIFFSFSLILGYGKDIYAFFGFAIYFLVLYSGYYSYKNNYKPALYFMVATGIGIAFSVLYFLMSQGAQIEYSILSVNLINIAVIWDLIFLSFALSYRIKLLQEENSKNERLAMLKSRETTIGELSGNIAHQWRTPLAELGAIQANVEARLRFSTISKEELLEQLNLGKGVVQHLSSTVDTFQSFFQNTPQYGNFCINDEVKRSISFVEQSLKNNGIEIEFIEQIKNGIITGNNNEFSQIILNIILNAKDALIAQNQESKIITIELSTYKNSFQITIRDNGGGIKIKPIESIFESYVTNKDYGNGIGLFIVKTIIEQKFGGEITVQNDKSGAIFKINM